MQAHAPRRQKLHVVGLQGDGLAVRLGCLAVVLLGAVPRALCDQLVVLVASPLGDPRRVLRSLAVLLLRRSAVLANWDSFWPNSL